MNGAVTYLTGELAALSEAERLELLHTLCPPRSDASPRAVGAPKRPPTGLTVAAETAAVDSEVIWT